MSRNTWKSEEMRAEDSAIFSGKLKELMAKRNITQLGLSALLGIGQSQISNWLNGKSMPTYCSLKVLSKTFQVNVSFFF